MLRAKTENHVLCLSVLTLLATVNMLKESVFFVTSGFFSATRAPRSSRIYRHKSWPSFRCFDRSRNWNKVCLGKIKRYVLSLIFLCSRDPSFSVQTGCYCWPSKSVFFKSPRNYIWPKFSQEPILRRLGCKGYFSVLKIRLNGL